MGVVAVGEEGRCSITDIVCIPDNQYTADNTCPTGTHEVAQDDGTYQCVAPSGVACAGLADLAACAYDWGTNTINGTCYSGACMATCSNGADNCVNQNSACQTIANSTTGVCVAQ